MTKRSRTLPWNAFFSAAPRATERVYSIADKDGVLYVGASRDTCLLRVLRHLAAVGSPLGRLYRKNVPAAAAWNVTLWSARGDIWEAERLLIVRLQPRLNERSKRTVPNTERRRHLGPQRRSTAALYRGDWQMFRAWLRGRPASEATLVAFIRTEKRRGLKLGTLRRRLIGINYFLKLNKVRIFTDAARKEVA